MPIWFEIAATTQEQSDADQDPGCLFNRS